MLLSMTGYGESHRQTGDLVVAVEVRAINSRYFKLTTRCSEGYASLETQIEAAARGSIKRGTVQVNLRVERSGGGEHYRLNQAVLAAYYRQIEEFQKHCHGADSVSLGDLLTLPGVVEEQASGEDAAGQWPHIEPVLAEALQKLGQMRATEGRAMAADLRKNVDLIEIELRAIQQRAPAVVDAYRGRLTERLNKLLSQYDVRVEPSEVIREVGLFAERNDIGEEVVRLQSHLNQFGQFIELPESEGRKLEFVVQEMFREANTIGSKSSDAEISRRVVEIKTSIERIREMVQNVE